MPLSICCTCSSNTDVLHALNESFKGKTMYDGEEVDTFTRILDLRSGICPDFAKSP